MTTHAQTDRESVPDDERLDDGAEDHAPFPSGPEDYEPEPAANDAEQAETSRRVRVTADPAAPLGRVADAHRPPEAWMTKLLWVKRTEGVGKERAEWYAPKSCVANAITILTNDRRWQGVICRNDFAEVDVSRAAPPWHADDCAGSMLGPWTDADTTRLRSWCDRAYGVVLGPSDLEQVVSVVAEANRFHPVRDYLTGLKWDGKERLPSMLCAYFNAPENEYTQAIGTLWMTSAVARAMQPGCQVDCLLILEGPQGKRKNAALRSLVPDSALYSETGIVVGQKDSYQSLHGVWIYVLDELASLKGRDVEKVKSFVSSPKDHFRAPYGSRFRDYPRQNVFAGTTNEERYFPDRTGNRRYWPVRVEQEIDVEAIIRDRDQLWAEAYARWKRGEKWYADTPGLRKLCEAEQEDRVEGDTWEELVAAWFQNPTEVVTHEDKSGRPYTKDEPWDLPAAGVTTGDVLENAIKMRPGDIDRADETRMGEVLRSLGYESGRVSENGTRVRRYTLAPGQPDQPSGASGCPDGKP